jgi:CelD/BcsL family acetyltransferase involved in cellulose biosynthesis
MSMTVTLAPTTGLRLPCTPLTDSRQLQELRPEWSHLLERSSNPEPMLSPEWLLEWWNVFGGTDGRRLRSLAIRDGDRLVGLALFASRRYWHRGIIPIRRLEPLGSGEQESDSICSDYLNVLAEQSCESAVAEAFAQAVTGGALGPWDELVLPMMDGENVMPALLADAFRSHGFNAELTKTSEAPYIELPSDWDEYLKGLTKKHRRSVVSSLRDFDAWAGSESELVRATTLSELERGKQILIDLHRQRWGSENGAGTFRSPRFLAFHDAVMPILLRTQALDLSWLTVRGEPIAAMYNIVWNNKVYYYQCGRKLDMPQSIRPGGVLLAHSIREAIVAGRREFDFLGGVALYKTQLATARRPLVQLRVARPGIVELLRRTAESCMDHVRSVRNHFRGFRKRALTNGNGAANGARSS